MAGHDDDTWRDMIALLRALNIGDDQAAEVILGNTDRRRVAAWLARAMPGHRDRQAAEATAAKAGLSKADLTELAKVLLDRYAAAHVIETSGPVTAAQATDYIETTLAAALASGPSRDGR